MSLVSCVTAQMQYTMMDSDCEDKAATIATKLKSVTEQGADVGKLLASIDNNIDQLRYAYREVKGWCAQAEQSNNPDVRSAIGQAQDKLEYYNRQYQALIERKRMAEREKLRLAAQEKELTAQQTFWSTMKKFAEGAMEKFKGFIDNAIKRFFG